MNVASGSDENPELLSEENPEPIEAEDDLEKDSGSKVSKRHMMEHFSFLQLYK